VAPVTRAKILRCWTLLMVCAVVAGACIRAEPPAPVKGEAPANAPQKSLHERWDKLLKANVNPQGWIDYKSLGGKDAGELKAYLRELAAVTAAGLGGKNAQKAFWINAYNAVCVQTIIAEGIPAEVPHAYFFGANIFKLEKYKVAGKVRSLDEIEHEILRVKYPDSRIHASVVCGASSCPRLRPEAYTGEQLDEQLDEEAKSWVSVEKDKTGKRKNYLDRKSKTYHVSKIFNWYEVDFKGGEAGVLRFLTKHGPPADREFLGSNKVQLEYLTYDWSSNKQ
jgi:hypothetical protein